MNDYQPQPGTIAARAVALLRTLEPGQQISTGELCDVLDQPSSSLIPSLQPARNCGLVKADYRPGDQRTLYWSMGDGKPITFAKIDGEDDEDENKAATKPKRAPKPIKISTPAASADIDAALTQIRTADVTPEAPRTAEDWMLAAAAGAEIPVPAPIWPAYREPETAEIPPPPDAATEAAQVAGKSELAEGHADKRPPREGVVRFALWSDGKLQIVIEGAAPVVLAREETKALIDYLDVMHGREVAAA